MLLKIKDLILRSNEYLKDMGLTFGLDIDEIANVNFEAGVIAGLLEILRKESPEDYEYIKKRLNN